MKQKLLITGGSGLLALNWAAQVKDRYNVILALHTREVNFDGVSTVRLAQASREAMADQFREIRPDIVIHTAGLTSVEACEQNIQQAREINTILAADVAAAAAAAGSSMVHISTDHLFDGSKPNVTEEEVCHPVNAYGLTKLEAEKMVLAAAPGALVIRTNFFGWGPSYRSSFTDTILQALRQNREINLFTDVYFTPVLMQCLIDAVHTLLDQQQKGIFHVVGGERVSKYFFGKQLAAAFNLNGSLIKPILFEDKQGLTRRPLDMSLSNHRLVQQLGHSLPALAEQFRQLQQLESMESIQNVISTKG
jgi:dTDP-4-dehydrorhamnose reductase